ncbi:DUF4062 domain-containing protein [Stieleria varia]|uniref:Uncharacterized protein n=1 Tax=Stieleria varia TaxID=2528005 RepID=A0A5C6A0B4_9BACT|nr:DUF4062 domain-containing protein [Stieleria varia]TWT93262.1 hypothetical protein Pla52n_59220 [Stieleria varia]
MTHPPTPVFVSSTFADLQEHRKAVCDALRQGGFLDIAMEYMGARDERPQNVCLRMIAEESDYFVGIYAHRYGYVPDDSGVSITEAEYHAAGNSDLKRLVYVVDQKTPWIPEYIDSGKHAEKLAQFKGLLGKRHVWKTFTSPDNLAKSVLADLGREVRSAQLKTVDQNSPDSLDASEWTNERPTRYQRRRFTELVHVIEPSSKPNQEYDILIYLFRHRPDNAGSPFGLDDVTKAEFLLGPSWKNRVFACDNDGGYIGIKVSAFGTFLCLCRVTFANGETAILDRYIDFESDGTPQRNERTMS